MQPLSHFAVFAHTFDAAHAVVCSGDLLPANEPALLWGALNAAHAYQANPDPAAQKARSWQVAVWAAKRLYPDDAARALAAFPAFAAHLGALEAVGATLDAVPAPAMRAPAPPPELPA